MIKIWTDGSCLGNPGPGGWSALVEGQKDYQRLHLNGGESNTTNNRMELLAAVSAIESLPYGMEVHLVTDSTYVFMGYSTWSTDWVANDWKSKGGKDIMNRDLWERLLQASGNHDLTLEWKRRNSTAEMEKVDELAKNQAEIWKNITTEGE